MIYPSAFHPNNHMVYLNDTLKDVCGPLTRWSQHNTEPDPTEKCLESAHVSCSLSQGRIIRVLCEQGRVLEGGEVQAQTVKTHWSSTQTSVYSLCSTAPSLSEVRSGPEGASRGCCLCRGLLLYFTITQYTVVYVM